LILRAYIELVSETRRQPTTAQIAQRAGRSVRLVFQHFVDLTSLAVAAARYAFEQGRAQAEATATTGTRQARIEAQVETRARNCEAWLALSRVTVSLQDQSPDLRALVVEARQLTADRLALMFDAELSTVGDRERRRLLIALQALTDFESWGRMRDVHALSVEEATAVWRKMVDRLLPATPAPSRAAPRRPDEETDVLSMPRASMSRRAPPPVSFGEISPSF